MAERAARVFTIPSGVDFPDTLAVALIDGRILPDWPHAHDPLSLSSGTIYLPTRRAVRALSERLAAHVRSDAVLLPKIIPLGGIDDAEDQVLLANGLAAFDAGEFPPEIAPARRRLILSRLIVAWSDVIARHLDEGQAEQHFARTMADALKEDVNGFIVAASPRDALHLADSLGQLIDTLTIHGKTWQDVHDLVPQDLADDYWKISRDFLEIAARQWPEHCKSNGVTDAAARRHHLIMREVERLRREQPQDPMIVAGSTGTMPATAELIAAIAKLPNGAVILPGLDQDLDDVSYVALTDAEGRLAEPQHPQAQLRRLIGIIGVSRADIPTLGRRDTMLDKRMRFLTEALRPVSTTDLWQSRSERVSDSDIESAFSNITIVEAAHEREEALAIAIALREALEVPDKSAALITPDRSLAERVQSELQRWNIEVEDSAGTSLIRTRAGRLMMLLAEAVAQDFTPWSLLALLSHPDARFGLDDDTLTRARRALDIGLFRHVAYPRGLDAIEAACRIALTKTRDHHRPRPELALDSHDWNAAILLLTQLKSICGSMPFRDGGDLVTLLPWHEAALRKITASADDPDAWDYVPGVSELTRLLQSVAPSDDVSLSGRMHDYPGFLDGLMRGTMVRGDRAAHPRIKIFGLLEARLLPVDLAILAGLDESVWPPDSTTDPFLNRPWRTALELPAPERRIGQTAHDLVSAMGARDVIMTRALKRAGSPTVASRFLQRMHAVAGDEIYKVAVKRGQTYLDLVYALDEYIEPEFPRRIQQPMPIVPREKLPTSLSVTRIETLRRDPYAIYAQYVLGLDPLRSVEPIIGPSEIGTAFHDALAKFGATYKFSLPANARDDLLKFGWDAFAPLSKEPEFQAFWWPRFVRAADWYLQWEEKRRRDLATELQIEQRGALRFKLPRGGDFTLTARADRIELHVGNSFSVIDYKTGLPPTAEQVRIGLAPQLTLEAAIVQHGGVSEVNAKQARELLYIKLGSRDGGEVKSALGKDQSADHLITQHFQQCVEIIDAHWNGGRPFASRPIAQFASRYSNYDHLARVKEWAMNAEQDEESEL